MEIGTELNVVDSYRVGDKAQQDRPVMVKLNSIAEINIILAHTVNLKEKKNAKRRLYFVDREMDPEKAEQKKIL